MKTYQSQAQKKAHCSALRNYGASLGAALCANDRQAADKSHADYEAECKQAGIDPDAEYADAAYN